MGSRDQSSIEQLRKNIEDRFDLGVYTKTRSELINESMSDFRNSIPKIGNQPAFTVEDIKKFYTQQSELSAGTQAHIKQFLEKLQNTDMSKATSAILKDLKAGVIPNVNLPGNLSTMAAKAERTILEWANKVPDMDSVSDAVYDSAKRALDGAKDFLKSPDLTGAFRKSAESIPRRVISPAMEEAGNILLHGSKKLGVVGVGVTVVAAAGAAGGAAQASEANGVSHGTARMIRNSEIIYGIDPLVVSGSIASQSRDYRLGLSKDPSPLDKKNFREGIEFANQVGSQQQMYGTMGVIDPNMTASAGTDLLVGAEQRNDAIVRNEFRNIDQRQKELLNRGSFPDKINLPGKGEIDTHIVLRDKTLFDTFRARYVKENSHGQFSDEIRTLDEFARLEARRDTMIDRAEARGDLNSRTADQLQNGTAQTSIRTGMTLGPGTS